MSTKGKKFISAFKETVTVFKIVANFTTKVNFLWLTKSHIYTTLRALFHHNLLTLFLNF